MAAKGALHKSGLHAEKKQKEYEHFCLYSFLLLSGGNKARLSATEEL